MSGAFDPPAGGDPGAPPPGAPAPEGTPPPDSGERRARPKRPRGLLVNLLLYGGVLALSLVLGALFFNLVVMPAFTHRGDEVRVPDLTGKDLTVAERLLAPKGLELGEANRRNDARPVGTIVAQHPAPNSSVKRGRLVSVVVSQIGRASCRERVSSPV